MSTPYLITFTPVNRFFFGSSHSFAEGFYVESMKYPQPTTVLGCLRDTILRQNGIDPRKNNGIPDLSDSKVKQLTGTSTLNRFDDNNNFGIIEKLSPVFIVEQGDTGIEDIRFSVPGDVEKIDNLLRYIEYKKVQGGKSFYSGSERDYAIRSDRNPKLSPSYCLGGREFWTAYCVNKQIPYNPEYDESKVFTTHTSVGIGRKGRVAKEGMFYTKIDYSFKEGYSFGVIVWLTEKVLQKGIVQLGGEQSTFCMKIQPVSDSIFSSHPVTNVIINNNCDFFETLRTANSNEKLVALSPIVFDETINKSLMDVMKHRIVQGIQSMRMLKSGGKGDKSESICMIPSGSVFYPEELADISMVWKIPYKIGYNYAIKIKKT